jgi:hypothetical protein
MNPDEAGQIFYQKIDQDRIN